MKKDFEVIDHTGDSGITAYGADMKQVFTNSARGLFSLITEIDTVAVKEQRDIEVIASDREALLVNWLNELIYLIDTKRVLFKKFDIISLTDTMLKATVYGEKINRKRHHLKREVKAATYHMLKIEQTENGWEAQVIFDI